MFVLNRACSKTGENYAEHTIKSKMASNRFKTISSNGYSSTDAEAWPDENHKNSLRSRVKQPRCKSGGFNYQNFTINSLQREFEKGSVKVKEDRLRKNKRELDHHQKQCIRSNHVWQEDFVITIETNYIDFNYFRQLYF